MLSTISYGDAVGNDTLAIDKLLRDMGFDPEIYAEHVDPKLAGTRKILPAYPLPALDKKDILIYHLSVGTRLNHDIKSLKCRKIAIYHNITPQEFFVKYSKTLFLLCREGLSQIKQLKDTFDLCLADSEFNKNDLISYGYKCPVIVRPILIPFEDYEKPPCPEIINKYNDGKTNIIFTGRVSPNKKQEDIISAFYCYRKHYNPESRLFIVGSSENLDSYQNQLDDFTRQLGVEDVIFTGKVRFDEVLAYYTIAGVFLCMSEHEGFCVPLAEAMFFDVPVIAYSSTAVPGTLSGSGILIDKKDPLITAGLINRLMTDDGLRQNVITGQRRRLRDFSYETVSEQLKEILGSFL